MTDRELLELAAKAAGVEGRYSEWREQGGAEGNGISKGGWDCWNPLTNDGDALRLAVKLGLDVEQRSDNQGVFVCKLEKNVDAREWAKWRECGGDMYATTRLAIVRAAAEIGRAAAVKEKT